VRPIGASSIIGTALSASRPAITSHHGRIAGPAPVDRMSLIAERLTSQLLSGPKAPDALAVAERLLAIQAQDLKGARLAIRARTARLTVSDVDRALSSERSLVISWLNRGTLHLVRSEDYALLHGLTAGTLLTGNARRLAQEGVTPTAADRGAAVIERSLAAEGPLTRAQLRDRLSSAGVRTEGQALVHLLMLACLRGVALRGPIVGRDQAYVLVRDWLGKHERVDRTVALAELARRYLSGHGPAGDRDLARWAGLPLREVRAGLSEIASELVERPDGLVDLARRGPVAPLPPPRLLGPFEPVLLGWVSREPLLDAQERLVTVNGLFRAFALVRGRAVATWGIRGSEITVTPFLSVSREHLRALERDAADVVRFLAGSQPAPPDPPGRRPPLKAQ
jgi:hypothetical protein